MIQVRMSRGVAVLTFNIPNKQTGPSISLTKDGHLNTLLREIDQQYDRNRRQIVVNITSVTKIDEDATIELKRRSSKGGIRICFYDMQKSVRNILKGVPGLSEVFDLYESEEAAIESFR